MDLPEDLIEDILSRVSVASLARLRSVSRIWNALLTDGRFAKKHSVNAPRHDSSLVLGLVGRRVYLMSVDLHGIHNNVAPSPSVKVTYQFSLKDPLSNNSSEEVDICNVSHCNGLMLCRTYCNRLVVWNPCSKETSWIQPIINYKDYNCYALGYDNQSSCYKILKMHERRYNVVDKVFQFESEVYDFASHSWRGVGVTTGVHYQERGVFVKGTTYRLAYSLNGQPYQFILSFDYSRERFQRVSLPTDALHRDVDISVSREEELCVLAAEVRERRVLDIHVWMATKIESTGAISWSKFLTVSGAAACYHHQYCTGMSFLADHKNKVVVSCNSMYSNMIIHIVGEDKYIELDHDDAEPTYRSSTLLTYVPSLVQI